METHELEDALTRGVRRMAAEARNDDHEHPSPDTLLAYDAGELGEEQAAGVRRHLAVCRECARTVLDLASFPDVEPAPGVEPLTDAEEEADWQRIVERLKAEEPKAPAPLRRRCSPARVWVVPLLAAALAVICLGLAFWVWRLHQQVEKGQAGPTANVLVVELTPVGTSARRGPEEKIAPAGTSSVLVLLNLADLRSFEDYRVTAREGDAEGEVVWSERGLVRGPMGNFSVYLPRESLPAGRYWIELEGLGKEGAERLAEYRLSIAYEDE